MEVLNNVWFCLLALVFIDNVRGQVCHEEGKCTGGTFSGIQNAQAYEECLQLCRFNSDCSWASYLNNRKECWLYKTCPNITADQCTNCFTGTSLKYAEVTSYLCLQMLNYFKVKALVALFVIKWALAKALQCCKHMLQILLHVWNYVKPNLIVSSILMIM